MEGLFDNLDGYYMPAFLYIQLNENIDFQNFENHPDEVKGTFIHEYCHFLQDVSTTYGYINFSYFIQEFLYKIRKEKDAEDKEILQHNKDFFNLYEGDRDISDDVFLISMIEIIEEEIYKELYPESDVRLIKVKYNLNKEFQFGNICIAESMAYLLETRLYNVRKRENEFPYNVCEEICKREYPAFAENEVWIMALCELSLLELNAGVFFVSVLRMMKEKRFIPTTIRDIETFIDQYFEIGFRGDKNVVESLLSEVYLKCNVDFSQIKKWILTRFVLGCECREISKCFISMALCNNDIHIRYSLWNTLMKEFGCPVLIDIDGNRVEGAYLDETEVDIGFMLAPMAINELLDRDGTFIQKPCPLNIVCRNANDPTYSEECMEDIRKVKDLDGLCPVRGFWRMYRLE